MGYHLTYCMVMASWQKINTLYHKVCIHIKFHLLIWLKCSSINRQRNNQELTYLFLAVINGSLEVSKEESGLFSRNLSNHRSYTDS